MNDTTAPDLGGHPDEDDAMARLLRLAGPRPDVPPERSVRVRGAVRAAWATNHRRRAIRRTLVVLTAGLATAAAVVLIVRPRATSTPASVPLAGILATCDRIEGAPSLGRPAEGRTVSLPLAVRTPVRKDDVLETDSVSRAALRTDDGSSMRLDRSSRARLLAPTVIELMEGAIYIATSTGSSGVEVRTPFGTVRDRGTRFEVRLGDATLRLRVRAGLVEIRRGADVVSARAGMEATVLPRSIDTRSVPIYGSDWEWTASLAPAFDIEGRPLAVFLEHEAREHGWTLRYADPELASAATTIVLHGSVERLSAEEAVSVAVRTSGLGYRLRDGEVLVLRPRDSQ